MGIKRMLSDELVKNAITNHDERVRICGLVKECPVCKSWQIQLIDTWAQQWKCRTCKAPFKTTV